MRNHNIHRRILQTCFTGLKKTLKKSKNIRMMLFTNILIKNNFNFIKI